MSYDPQIYGVAFVKAGLHLEDDFKLFLAEDKHDAIEQCVNRFKPIAIKGVYVSLPLPGTEGEQDA